MGYFTASKRYPWPEPFRAAFSLTVDVDSITPMLWRTRRTKNISFAEVEQRQFGIRQGVGRILEVLDTLDMSATFFVPGFNAEQHPTLVPEIIHCGHEVGLHGYFHENVRELSLKENEQVLRRAHGILAAQSGEDTFGYRSPAWDMAIGMIPLLQQLPVLYDSSLMGLEQPYTIGGLVELPVSWTMDDATFFFYLGNGEDSGSPRHAHQVEQAWLEEIASSLRFGGLINLTIHPWMIGRAATITMLERVLTKVRAERDIWVTTCRELAQHHKSLPADVISTFAPFDASGLEIE